MNNEMIKKYISDVLEMAEAVKSEPDGDFKDGKLLAYNEVLSALKTDLTPLGIHDFGLDFDIDRKLA